MSFFRAHKGILITIVMSSAVIVFSFMMAQTGQEACAAAAQVKPSFAISGSYTSNMGIAVASDDFDGDGAKDALITVVNIPSRWGEEQHIVRVYLLKNDGHGKFSLQEDVPAQ